MSQGGPSAHKTQTHAARHTRLAGARRRRYTLPALIRLRKEPTGERRSRNPRRPPRPAPRHRVSRWTLIWANLTRHRARFAFTLLSVIFAFALFGVLLALRQAFGAGVRFTRTERLLTMNAVSLVNPLPLTLGERIATVSGVRAVDGQAWFGGYYRHTNQAVYALAVQGRAYLEVYPHDRLRPRAQRAWLAERRGVLIGTALARRFGWRVGEHIPLRSSIWRNRDGTNTWQVIVAGIMSSRSGRRNGVLLMHYRYLDESRTFANRTVNFFVLRINDPRAAGRIGTAVDARFANSPNETRTAPESVIVRNFTAQFGDIAAIVTAVVSSVFFTMLLVTGNTMTQSVRERRGEFALLAALGFRARDLCTLVLLESLALTALGAVLGLAAAYALIGAFGYFAASLLEFLPGLALPADAPLEAASYTLILGAAAALLPILTLLSAPVRGLREG